MTTVSDSNNIHFIGLRAILLGIGLMVSTLLAGCAWDGHGVQSTASPAFSGLMRGGQQPISGATIKLYAAGYTGYGQGATSLLTNSVVTDAYGNFNVTSDYTCPSATTQVYLVGSGGNPGLTPSNTNNASILMVDAIGDCSNLSLGNFVTIDEVTTAGAAFALQQFLGTGGIIGTSSTNATGLRNAFLTALNLADNASGTSPGRSMPSTAVMETAKLYTVADALATCVNSNGTACGPLFTAATDNSVTPSNTLDAALAIVQNPAAHLSDVLNAAGSTGPFQPTLSSAPNDWTMSVNLSGGGMNLPTAVGVDDAGDVWVANYFGGAVSAFAPDGVALAASGFPGATQESYGLTIDSNHQIWVTNEETPYAVNTAGGSMTVFQQSSGTVVSGSGYSAGGIFFPVAAAADPSGRVWVADYGRSEATLLANNGSAVSSSPFSGSLLAFPAAIAIDASQNAWLAGQGAATKITPGGTLTSYPCCGSPSGIAVDQGGNVWLADYQNLRLVEISSSGSLLAQPTSVGGLNHPQGIAVDGAGTIWNTNYRGNNISAFSGYASSSPGTALSPATGYGVAAGMSEPYSIAIDASGNAWVSSSGNNLLTEVVGVAVPIKTPLLGPPTKP